MTNPNYMKLNPFFNKKVTLKHRSFNFIDLDVELIDSTLNTIFNFEDSQFRIESQKSLECGAHALNNLFGSRLFVSDNIIDDEITLPINLKLFCIYTYIKNSKTDHENSLHYFCDKSGNYDIQVLINAVSLIKYNMDDRLLTTTQFDKNIDLIKAYTDYTNYVIETLTTTPNIGLLVNISKSHWICIRRYDNYNYQYIDSMSPNTEILFNLDELINNLIKNGTRYQSISLVKPETNIYNYKNNIKEYILFLNNNNDKNDIKTNIKILNGISSQQQLHQQKPNISNLVKLNSSPSKQKQNISHSSLSKRNISKSPRPKRSTSRLRLSSPRPRRSISRLSSSRRNISRSSSPKRNIFPHKKSKILPHRKSKYNFSNIAKIIS